MNDETTIYKGLKETQETLPASFYLDAAHYERELQSIWYRNWVYVCRADALDQARSFRTVEIGSQNILVLRDENGDLQAFHNTCRHRGSVLCTENEGRLRSKVILCPYHNWVYSLQGDLQRTPSKHCPSVHPELCKMVPIYGRAYMEPEEDPNWPDNRDSTDPKFIGGMREGAQTWTIDGQPVGKPFEGLSESERKAGYHYVVNCPSVFIAAHIDYVRIVRLLPMGTEKTELQVEWLFSEETLADKSIDIEKAASFAKLVMQQDAFVSELNQKGLHCIQHKHGVLMAEDYDVYNFQNWVREQLRSE